jgi:phytoene dehydrogenase-like protein
MSQRHKAIVVGAGHNGLIAAFYLAKAGMRPLVLERRPMVGGVAVTEEFAPGFRASTVAHLPGPLRPEVIRDMRLSQNGLRMSQPAVRVAALREHGPALLLHDDLNLSVAQLGADGAKLLEFARVIARMAHVFAEVGAMVPPAVDHPSAEDLYRLLKTGRAVRKLGKQDMYRLLRWGPMPIADLMDEWFHDELLKAAIGSRSVFNASLGPWSPGSANLLLLRSGDDPHPAGPAAMPAGGMGALTEAMAAAAKAAGAEIRTGVEVDTILGKDGAATGVRLQGGDEIGADFVVSNADPLRTLMKLVDPAQLAPHFLLHLKNYRCAGVAAKVNLALDGSPAFQGVSDTEALEGRIHIGETQEYMERAFDASKYGEFSRAPYLEVTIPTLTDPSLAPAGKHVMSIHAQYAPYRLRGSDWNGERQRLGETVVRTLARYAPELPQRVLAMHVLTPEDLSREYGLTGGHLLHGEATLDQFFTMRPMLGWARYETPIRNLYLCGSGTHPGWSLNGASGMNAARQIIKARK